MKNVSISRIEFIEGEMAVATVEFPCPYCKEEVFYCWSENKDGVTIRCDECSKEMIIKFCD